MSHRIFTEGGKLPLDAALADPIVEQSWARDATPHLSHVARVSRSTVVQVPAALRHAVQIGRPYTIRGITYVPAAAPHFDQVGYASWHGSETGNRTARGEKFRPGAISAHTALPLPTYVEVTALETGRTILVRVNDRGPFVIGRLIELSRGAAEILGIRAQGHTPVRVRRVAHLKMIASGFERGSRRAPVPD